MRKFSRNKQKDKRPFAGLRALKQMLVIPVAVFAFIASISNIAIISAI